MPDSIRTFVAVEIAAPVRQAAVALIETLRQADAGVKWVDRENMHLTLKFLGQVPATQISDICRAVSQAVADTEPFAIEIQGLGAFPNARRPRTIWLGVTDGHDQLVALARHVQKALKPLGFKPEDRAFSPHLTIGRVREGGQGLAEHIAGRAEESFGRTALTQVVVFSSLLGRTGPTYTALCHSPLRGAGLSPS